MEQQLSEQMAPRRFQTSLLTLFSIIALALASLGIYGVMSYAVVQRTHEIGIRVALGAQTGDVLGMLFRQGLRLALIGLGAGLAGAWLLTQLLKNILYGVTPTDPVTYITVSLVLIGVAAAAISIPARRAIKVDPLEALRQE
jgi:ABC-type antimicrobial peptide transport system permease subunit